MHGAGWSADAFAPGLRDHADEAKAVSGHCLFDRPALEVADRENKAIPSADLRGSARAEDSVRDVDQQRPERYRGELRG